MRTAKGRSAASQRWLARQLNDPYVAAAKQQGFRSRAAFKLVELDERFRLIRRGALVVDLGAAPGGWTQVAVQRGAARVVGVDLLPVDPVAGRGDAARRFHRARRCRSGWSRELGGKADLVLSDMAPNTTGHAATDHLRIMALAEAALEFALEVLAEGGGFVAKVFQGGAEKAMLERLSGTSPRSGTPSRRRAGRNPANYMWWRPGFRVSPRVSGNAVQILGALHLDQHGEALLVGVAVLLGLHQPAPDLLVLRAGFHHLRRAIEPGDAALRQHAVGAQLRLAEIHRDLCAVVQRCGGRALAALPQRDVVVVKHHRAAARRDLRVAVRQHGADQAYMLGEGAS